MVMAKQPAAASNINQNVGNGDAGGRGLGMMADLASGQKRSLYRKG
jgi:hypothetical protein